ncbi:MAG: Gfo/Idh/MocA family protein [Vulcanimicrobiota bacterium]
MINIGVIGAGYWGPNLVRNFQEISDTRVLMCSDVRQNRLDFINTRYPSIQVSTNSDELLTNPDIDAVAIATHAASHYELAKKAMENGKHVLVEKPLAMTGEEALELHQLSKKKNLVLMVGHIMLYSGGVEFLKDAITSGELGNIFYLDSTRVNMQAFREDVNVVWDLAPHDISLSMYLLGEDPISCRVTAESYVSDQQENIAFGILRFPNDIISHFHLSWLAPMKMRQTSIVGSRKMVVFDDVDTFMKVKIYDKGVDITPHPRGLTERQLTVRKGDIVCPKIDDREPLMKEVNHFIDCVRDGSTPRSDGLNGWKVVKVIEAMQKSMKNKGSEVEIDLSEAQVAAKV